MGVEENKESARRLIEDFLNKTNSRGRVIWPCLFAYFLS